MPGHSAKRQRQRRQHDEAQIGDRVFGERHIAGRRQPAQFDREQIDQQDRGQECRHRQHAEGGAGHEAVERRRRFSPRRRSPAARRSQARRARAKIISSNETGNRSATACSTVCPVRNERPKSPCRIWPSQPSNATRSADRAPCHGAAPQLLRRRLVAEDHVGEIAGQQRGDQERQQRDGEQHRHQIEQPAGDEEQHAVIPSRRAIRRSPRCTFSASPSPWRSRSRSRCSGRSRTRSPPC